MRQTIKKVTPVRKTVMTLQKIEIQKLKVGDKFLLKLSETKYYVFRKQSNNWPCDCYCTSPNHRDGEVFNKKHLVYALIPAQLAFF